MAAPLRSLSFPLRSFLSATLGLLLAFSRTADAQQIGGSPIVTPDGQQTLFALRNATGRIATFLIESQSDYAETYALACTFQGLVTGCSVPTSRTVDARQTVTVDVTFSVGAVGAGRVDLSVTGSGGEDSGWYGVNVQTVVSSGVTTGTFHSCGLGGAGEAYCWGYNAYGQLGTGSAGGTQLAPVAVTGGVVLPS